MTTLHHPNCHNPNCLTCLEDHLALGDELGERSGVTRVDHLGKYKRWFSDQEIEDETEWGWGMPFIFNESYITRYLREVWEIEE